MLLLLESQVSGVEGDLTIDGLMHSNKCAELNKHLHPLTSVVARAAVGSSSVGQPAAVACIVPAQPTAACAAVMPEHQLSKEHHSDFSMTKQAD